MSIETKRLKLAIVMSRLSGGRFTRRPKTVRVSSRSLLEQAEDEEIHPAEIALIEVEARGEFDDD